MEQGAGSREQGGGKAVSDFRFQDFEIWKKAVEIGSRILDEADRLEDRRMHRFAEQLRAAALSVSNNIAEGSGSSSDKEFASFLNIARRSAFETANMLIIFDRRGLISEGSASAILAALAEECRMITGFRRTIRTNSCGKR
jgi:four helix bundle protein